MKGLGEMDAEELNETTMDIEKRVLRKWVVYGVYALTFLSVFSSIYFIEKSLAPENTFNNDKDYVYVSKTIFDNEVPVVASGTQIIRPYKATDVEIAKNYYDYKADADTQKRLYCIMKILTYRIVV